MACEGCKQKLLVEQNDSVNEEAKTLANNTGQWVAIYKDEFGGTQFILADQAGQYPVIRYISPELHNNTDRVVI